MPRCCKCWIIFCNLIGACFSRLLALFRRNCCCNRKKKSPKLIDRTSDLNHDERKASIHDAEDGNASTRNDGKRSKKSQRSSKRNTPERSASVASGESSALLMHENESREVVLHCNDDEAKYRPAAECDSRSTEEESKKYSRANKASQPRHENIGASTLTSKNPSREPDRKIIGPTEGSSSLEPSKGDIITDKGYKKEIHLPTSLAADERQFILRFLKNCFRVRITDGTVDASISIASAKPGDLSTPEKHQLNELIRSFQDTANSKGNPHLIRTTSSVIPLIFTDSSRLYLETSKGIILHVLTNDIVLEKVKVLVNAADSNLNNKGGVSRAIARAGGKQLQEACDNYFTINGHLDVGQYIYTTSGNLSPVVDYIVHAIGPKQNHDNCEQVLTKLFGDVFGFVNKELRRESLALPAIGTGYRSVPLDITAKSLLSALVAYSESVSSERICLRDINFVNNSADATSSVIQAICSELTKPTLELAATKPNLTGVPASKISTDLSSKLLIDSVNPIPKPPRGLLSKDRPDSTSEPSADPTPEPLADSVPKHSKGFSTTYLDDPLTDESSESLTDPEPKPGTVLLKPKSSEGTSPKSLTDSTPTPLVVDPTSENLITPISRKPSVEPTRETSPPKQSSNPRVQFPTAMTPEEIAFIINLVQMDYKVKFGQESQPLTYTISSDQCEMIEIARTEASKQVQLLIKAYENQPSDIRRALKTIEDPRNNEPVLSTTKNPCVPLVLLEAGRLYFETTSGIKVHVYSGDITREGTDVIVNTWDGRSVLNGALSRAVARAAGENLVDACEGYVVAQGRVKVGDVIHTTGGKLRARAVVHAVGPNYRAIGDDEKCYDILLRTLGKCLTTANDELRMASIAIPAIGTGNNGVPIPLVTLALVESVFLFVDEVTKISTENSLKDVRFVSFEDEITEAIRDAFLEELGILTPTSDDSDEEDESNPVADNSILNHMSFESEPRRRKRIEEVEAEEEVHSKRRRSEELELEVKGETAKGSRSAKDEELETASLESTSESEDSGHLTASGESVEKQPELPSADTNFSVGASTLPLTSADLAETCPLCLETVSNPRKLPCAHVFCTDCIQESFKLYQPKCPSCGKLFGVLRGNQPDGEMEMKKIGDNIPGYPRCGAIQIMYYFPDGIQQDNHPNPGEPYEGTARRAFLPNNSEGEEVLKLLRKAFEARLLFTIGTSVTTGLSNTVTWNDIHHKTQILGQPYGYPDPKYLERVKEELASKGIVP